MLALSGKELEDYKKDNLEMKDYWKNRDFVSSVKNYYDGKTEKVLAVSGLRGTGKTVGILQAASSFDALYILSQKGEKEVGKDYIKALENTDRKYIIIDEYSWIKDRDELDRYLLTSLQNGKRIVITGTESITLDFLNYGALNHRVSVIHTTMFTYQEYLRIYDKKPNKDNCTEYLLEGGLFKEDAIKKYESMRRYVEEAIVNNLAGYLKDEIDLETARTLTYSVLYKAICPSNLSEVPTLRSKQVTLSNFLDVMGINTSLEIKPFELQRVSEIFEQIGLITRIKNFDKDNDLKEQYYISNPSLTYQLIRAAYGLEDLDKSILGHVFESCVLTQLATNKLSEHNIYFLNNSGKEGNEYDYELDGVITDRELENIYLFECKYSEKSNIHRNTTLVSGKLEKDFFDGENIAGRYVIYNGESCVRNFTVGKVIFIPMGDMLNYYFEFDKNAVKLEVEDKLASLKLVDEQLGENNISDDRKEFLGNKAFDLANDILDLAYGESGNEHNYDLADNDSALINNYKGKSGCL